MLKKAADKHCLLTALFYGKMSVNLKSKIGFPQALLVILTFIAICVALLHLKLTYHAQANSETRLLTEPLDTAEPYARLGRQMELPQTACLVLPGPLGPVPGTPQGRAWFDEEDEEELAEVSAVRSTANIMCIVDGSFDVYTLPDCLP